MRSVRTDQPMALSNCREYSSVASLIASRCDGLVIAPLSSVVVSILRRRREPNVPNVLRSQRSKATNRSGGRM